MKVSLGAFAVAATLAYAGSIASTSATAASPNGAPTVESGVATSQTASDTDVSARRRHWRRHRYVQPYPYVYPSYGYYRPRPYYYRPHGYHRPGPFFSFGFGPRYYW